MSQETEQDLQRQLEEEESTIQACIKRQDELNKALEVIRSKPEPSYGDFGFRDGRPAIVVHPERGSSYSTNSNGVWLFSKECGCTFGNPKLCDVQGNIFDLMKEAGEDGVIIALSKEEAEYFEQDFNWVSDIPRAIGKKIQAVRNR